MEEMSHQVEAVIMGTCQLEFLPQILGDIDS